MGLFSQVPGEQVSVCPCCALPAIDGGSRSTGGSRPGSEVGRTGVLTAGTLEPEPLLATTVQVIS